jgi:hypothetical protein
MALYVAEHTHAAETCPAANPQMAGALLQVVSPTNASKAGIRIFGDAVANGKHHLYLIVDAENESVVRQYFAPFGQLGTLEVTPASHCEDVVNRGKC